MNNDDNDISTQVFEQKIASKEPCVFPPLAEESVDSILYKGEQEKAAALTKFQRKPPHIDHKREYQASHSHKKTRETIKQLTEKHRQLQVRNEEDHHRRIEADKFATRFVEERLATNGIPTLNNMPVIIARRRAQKVGEKPDEALRNAIRRALGSGQLDLKSFRLNTIPMDLFNTLSLQLGRFIKIMNLSRNELREFPGELCESFLGLETIFCKDNQLLHLPNAIIRLEKLKKLVAECNQLIDVPQHLPLTLNYMSLSRNRLHAIPNLFELIHLTDLDLSHNLFKVLPPAMFLLQKLKRLNLSGNKLISLAVFRKDRTREIAERKQAEQKEQNPREEFKKWRVEVDPGTGESIYFHLEKKEVSRSKPKCFLEVEALEQAFEPQDIHPDVPRLQLGAIDGKSINKAASAPKIQDESLYSDGWEIIEKPHPMRYIDHNSNQTYFSIPPALDRLGALDHIEYLFMSGNELEELPPSIGRLFRLKRLEVENNRLFEVPDVLHDLKLLESLKLGMNSLSYLPPSIICLESLSELDLKLNRIKALPEDFGKLRRLKVVDLSSNSLEVLPTSILDLKRLMTLKLLNNNELICPRQETLNSDIKVIFWEIHHKMMCDNYGKAPPVPESAPIGVGNEVWSTNIHVHKEICDAIDKAKQTNVLDFHWKHLTVEEFPHEIFSLANLQELRLSGHVLRKIPASFSCLTSLRLLQLRRNEIEEIDDDCFADDCCLEDIDLEYNKLKRFPESIGYLKKLRVLHASNNHLEDIPMSMRNLSELSELYLAHNHFAKAPAELSYLIGLTKLDLSYNQLLSLEEIEFTRLLNLQVLRANVNRLTDLPESLGEVPLEELCLSGNQFIDFGASLFRLHNTLKILKIQINKLYTLPVEFGILLKLETIEADGNPLRAPPMEIMQQGIQAIRVYLIKRMERLQELDTVLRTSGFEVDKKVWSLPKIHNLLIGKLEFLTKEDLIEFDHQVDLYVNCNFYLLPHLRGVDIVNGLLQKQFLKAQLKRRAVLEDVLKLFDLIKRKKWLDKIDFRYDLTRPWGRDGEEVGVYMVDPIKIFQDEPDLPSILSVIKKRVYHGFKEESFSHDQATIEDALNHYIGVFGPVGIVHDTIPFRCGCEELLRYGKMHDPCYKDGWVLQRVIYTEEEAERRVKDEAKIKEAKNALRPQINNFLNTKDGHKRFRQEISKIKQQLKIDIKKLKKRLSKQRKKLKNMEEEFKNFVLGITKEKENTPAPSIEREIKINEQIEDKELDLKLLRDRVTGWEKDLMTATLRQKQNYDAFREEVLQKLLDTVGVEVQDKIIKQQRDRALEFGLRRPWDGPNGAHFIQYKRAHRRDGRTEENNEKEGDKGEGQGKNAQVDFTDDDSYDEIDSDNSIVSDVSFGGYEDLTVTAQRKATAQADEEEEEEEDNTEIENLVVSDVSSSEEEHDKEKNANDSDDSDL